MIENSKGEQAYITISWGRHIYDVPLNKDDIDNFISDSRQKLLESKRALKPSNSHHQTVLVNLIDYHLNPGMYKMYFIYSCSTLPF